MTDGLSDDDIKLRLDSHGALVAALTTLRAKFHRALVIGGTDPEFADAACEQADAALALAAPQPEPATGADPSVPTPSSTEVA